MLSSDRPLLPAGIGITRLKVYDTEGSDGVPGGSPHFHLLCTELYVVLGGSGEVETLSPHGVCHHNLEPGKLVWFEPGVVHRLINTSRDLDILVVMQNSGLPEAGDFVLCFPPEILADPDRYREHASLASGAFVYASSADAAQARRNLAVKGYEEWRAAYEDDGAPALERLYRLGLHLVRPQLDTWRSLVAGGPQQATESTQRRLDELQRLDLSTLLTGRAAEQLPDPEFRLGVCGHLTIYPIGIPT